MEFSQVFKYLWLIKEKLWLYHSTSHQVLNSTDNYQQAQKICTMRNQSNSLLCSYLCWVTSSTPVIGTQGERQVSHHIQGMTRAKLHGGIKRMLTDHHINLLCDDWRLINEECRDDILGDLKANNKTKAANRLIDYLHDNHTGEELLHFRDFLMKEAKDAGRNTQLLKLAKSIKEAVHDASSGPSGMLYSMFL